MIGASAAVVCLGGALAACGGGGGGGYVATGAAGGPPRVSGTAVTPTGDVTLVPLDGSGTRGPGDSPAGEGSRGGKPGDASARPTGRAVEGGENSGADHAEGRTEAGAESGPAAASSPPDPSSTISSGPATPPGPTTTPSPAPGGPAVLSWQDPVREPTDKRWCEKVTVEFHNSGQTAVRSGTVSFGTHVIGALGIDWATVESTEDLPAPIGAGARKERTWTVCVDAWRVPLGMHIETRDVSVRWK
ncbi:hypothetical protein ACIO93_29505 [Streptomyces sp. NPDC087903]|uniref:hypothetical protein n=1 Tax=Streptomyces sp. NPDC087903 TaxID=3365819 RepID=UPI00382F687F